MCQYLLDSQYIHDRAVALYSMDRVKWRYETYFKQLRDLSDEGLVCGPLHRTHGG